MFFFLHLGLTQKNTYIDKCYYVVYGHNPETFCVDHAKKVATPNYEFNVSKAVLGFTKTPPSDAHFTYLGHFGLQRYLVGPLYVAIGSLSGGMPLDTPSHAQNIQLQGALLNRAGECCIDMYSQTIISYHIISYAITFGSTSG
jgi:hypothetical protein